MFSPSFSRALALATFAAAGGVAAAQTQPGTVPQRFRSGVEVLRVDVTAVDTAGRPVRDLTAADFAVNVDGKDRKVLFVHFSGPPAEGSASTPASSQPLSSFTLNIASQPGRAVMFVVDLESIKGGTERVLLDTAATLVESLGAADAVGLAPVPGTLIDLTRDRHQVAAALRGLRGTNNLPSSRHFFTIEEALAFENATVEAGPTGRVTGGDQRTINTVIERECDEYEAKSRAATKENPLRPICPPQLIIESRERLAYERTHVQHLLASVSSVGERLQHVDAPRTIVLVSAGLAFEPESLVWYRRAQQALKQAGVMLYAVHVDQPTADAAASRPFEVEIYASRDRQTGLANVATMTDGAFFAGVGRATGVFDRLRAEMSHWYELGVQAVPQDDDGKPHPVTVAVTRPGVSVRSRREVVLPLAVDPLQKLASLIMQPLDVADLPIAAATYTVRGEEATTVKVILSAEFGRGLAITPPVRYAVAVRSGGQPVFETNGTATDEKEGARLLVGAQLAPGQYRLRIAGVDASGRGGSLEMPIAVGLRAAADLQLSDLILGGPTGASAPSIHTAAGSPVAANLELYSADPGRFGDARVRFEIRRTGTTDVLSAADGVLRPTSLERRQVADGAIATAGFQPGRYTISAIVSAAGSPVGRVSRDILLIPPPPASAVARAKSAPPERSTGAPRPPATGDAALDAVLTKVGEYVAAYGEKASVLVAVEKYTQYVTPQNGVTLRPRQLVAEFALVKTGGPIGWAGYRDVVEVNGEALQDRRDRLQKLFTAPVAALNEAARIADESARFNVGPVARNFNLPTTSLFFFHPTSIGRFTFTRKGTKKVDGIETWELAFRETASPTLIATRAGKDVPCEGTIWVIPADGTIVRTRLRLRGFADAFAMIGGKAPAAPIQDVPQPIQTPTPAPSPGGASGGATGAGSAGGTGGSGGAGGTGSAGGSTGGAGGSTVGQTAGVSARRPRINNPLEAEIPTIEKLESRADIEVTYRRDEQAGMWLPTKMSEEYQGAIPRINREPLMGTARSTATYSDFKRFETSGRLVGPK